MSFVSALQTDDLLTCPSISTSQIFTADPDTVEPLPRHDVLVHLETVSPRATVAFLEFLVDKLGEKGSEFHDRLAELYLDDVKKGKKKTKGT